MKLIEERYLVECWLTSLGKSSEVYACLTEEEITDLAERISDIIDRYADQLGQY